MRPPAARRSESPRPPRARPRTRAVPERRALPPRRRIRPGAPFLDARARRRRAEGGTRAESPPAARRKAGVEPPIRAGRRRQGPAALGATGRRTNACDRGARPSRAAEPRSRPRWKRAASRGAEGPRAPAESRDRRLRSCLLLGWGRRELIPQGSAAPRQLALRRPGRDVQDEGDLVVRIAPDVVEN